MRFGVLGPLVIERDGETITITSGRQRALLANLLVAGGQPVAADVLIDAVWGDDLPANPANTLQHGVAQLRKLLEPGRTRNEAPKVLVSEGAGYRLDLHAHDLDGAEFGDEVERVRDLLDAGSASEALEHVEAALSLWRGPAYADFQYDDFARPERERLDELRVVARELRVDARTDAHGPEAVVSDLEGLVAEFPLREGLWARLMRALYQGGRQAEALRVYRRAAGVLGDELGIEPSAELRELEEQILLQDPQLTRPAADRLTHNLPRPTTRLIGRDRELETLLELVRSVPLVTLLGPGGTGKTRLALEVAGHSVESFPGGVWLVRLDTLADPALIAAHIGGVLRMPEAPDSDVVDTLARFIGETAMLIILDNCEHLIGEVAAVVDSLLSRCPNLTLLTTSQEALQLSGERRYPVPPLSLPGAAETHPFQDLADSPAVELFMDRATAIDPSLDRSDTTMAAVANIVAALDGIPLAIELAAGRTDVLSPVEIAQRLADRFELLDAGPRDAPVRQRTLRDAVAWAYDPLGDDEQAFFAAVSVLVGGFHAAGAAAVAAVSEDEALRLIRRLVQRSLLVRVEPVGGITRYRMLETLRQFGIEQLGDGMGDVQRRHAEYYAAHVYELDRALGGSAQTDAFASFLAEQDNLRAAMAWSLDSAELGPGVIIAARTGRFWDWHGSLAEATTWMERLSNAEPDRRLPERALLESWCSFFLTELGDRDRARTFLTNSRVIAESNGDWNGLLGALTGEAMNARLDGDPAEAAKLGAEIRDIATKNDEPWIAAWADNHDALALLALGDVEAARDAAQRSYDAYSVMGDRRATGWALTALAQTAFEAGEHQKATDLAQKAVTLSLDTGDGRNAAWAYEIAGAAARADGNTDRAEELDAEAADLILARGMPSSPWHRSGSIS